MVIHSQANPEYPRLCVQREIVQVEKSIKIPQLIVLSHWFPDLFVAPHSTGDSSEPALGDTVRRDQATRSRLGQGWELVQSATAQPLATSVKNPVTSRSNPDTNNRLPAYSPDRTTFQLTDMDSPTEAAQFRLPTEIWHLILLAFIDVRDAIHERDHRLLGVSHICPNKDTSHALFGIAEERRKLIKLVCKSWKQFAEEHANRSLRLKEMENKAQDLQIESVRRHIAAFWVELWEQDHNECMDTHEGSVTFQRLLSEPTNIVIISTNVSGRLASHALDIMRRHQSSLPLLRFLTMKIVGSDISNTLSIISNSFGDRLTHLKLSYKIDPFLESDVRASDNREDKLSLPNLKFLEWNFPSLNRNWTTLSDWSLPSLEHLSIGSIATNEDVNELIDALESFGGTLRSLVLRRSEDLKFIRMPMDFWELIPNLETFTTSLDGLSFIGNPSPNAPLSRIIHEGQGSDRFMIAIRPMLSPPWPHIKAVVLCKVWWHLLLSNEYMERHLFGAENRLFELADWCERKSIQMLDGLGRTLRQARESRVRAGSSSVH